MDTMIEEQELEWLDYTGQSAAELLAAEGKYRIDSLCCAFEWALRKKAGTAADLTDEELVVLAVEAIEREVNNGGYRQFFANSSHVYSLIAVDALGRIGCPETASFTKKAVEALKLKTVTPRSVQKEIAKENPERDEILEACDNAYYNSGEPIAGRLFAFIKKNAGQYKF
jgi:Domain of unknown function (DUF4375)